jgi:hypothetical protein
VEGALSLVAELARADAAARRSVIEAACLICAADGHVEDAERDAIARLAAVASIEGGAERANAHLDELAAMATTPRIADEAVRIGRALKSANASLAGITAAALVGLVSEGMSLAELALLRRLSVAAGLSEDALGTLIEAAETALSA